MDTTDRGLSHDALDVLNELRVSTEEQVQGIQPKVHPFIAGSTAGDLCDEIIRIVRGTAVQALRQVVCPSRRIQQFCVIVQLRNINGDHRFARVHSVDNVLIITVLHDELLICEGAKQCIQQTELVLRDCPLQVLAVTFYHFFVDPQGNERVLCCRDGFLCVGKLRVQECLHDTEGLLFVLIPAVTSECEVIRRTRVTEAVRALSGKHPRLADVGVVLRLHLSAAELIVILLRRNVGRISLYLLCKLDGALPDGLKLRCRERRLTLLCTFQEQFMGLVADAILLQDPPSEVGHGVVPGALHDGATIRRICCVVLRHIVQIRKDLIHGQEPFMPEHLVLRDARPVHEPARIQSIIVKERIFLLERCLDGLDLFRALATLDRRVEMKTWPRRLFSFRKHVVATGRRGKLHIHKVRILRQLLRRHPPGRIFCVVIITIHLDDRCFYEIVIAAVIIQI